jgi:HCOMODA/2-hydroxy-3-carboxy-muconic semialdehyde decarboxylase
LHHYGKFLPADGPPVFNGVGLVRTVERGDALAAALGNSTVVLMRAHGDTVVGDSIQQVVERTVRLARLGELAHLALLHGNPRYLSAEELDTFSSDVRFPARGWEYYVSRLATRRS